MLQSARDCDESVVFIAISELVEVTEEATDNALFQSEDLLQDIGHHGDTKGVHGMDLTHVVAKTRGAVDDDAYNPPGPRVNIATSDTDTYETWDPAVPHRTGSGATKKKMPPDQAVRSVRAEDPWKELNPRNGQENEPSGARHPTENDEALSELGGLKGLEHTLSEQTSHIGNARNQERPRLRGAGYLGDCGKGSDW